jgi:UDP-hydrolysing UDP-N-acetyl-D-glucosamine 2-epimerase
LTGLLSKPHRLAVLSTGRQDYGILYSTLRALQDEESIEVQLLIGGMHFLERFGRTIEVVRTDGLPISAELPFLSDPPDALNDAAEALRQVGTALTRLQPAALMLVGDRSETMAAALAATFCRVPIVHLHGGEESEGAIDNVLRHAITKLSHLHLVSHEIHAHRVIQMGEIPKDVVVVGAPGLDNRFRADLPDRMELEATLGISLKPPVVIVTVHPTTLGNDPLAEARAVSGALEEVSASYVITAPNADPGGDRILEFWKQWVPGRSNAVLVGALGERMYWGLLRMADAVLGNSSSGLVEAPDAGVPTINIGDRQKGRLRAASVVDISAEVKAIATALRCVLEQPPPPSPQFLAGPAAPRIVAALREWLPRRTDRKSFRALDQDSRSNRRTPMFALPPRP